MLIHRSRSLVLLGLLTAGLTFAAPTQAATPPTPHPILWLAQRGAAKVWIFGAADTRDQSWLTPHIRQAFDESQEVWFEAPKPDPTTKAASMEKEADALEQKLGYDQQRSLFDDLGSTLSARLLQAAQQYGVPRAALEHTRPWEAYFVLNHGYWAQRVKAGLGGTAEAPDAMFARMAWAAHKTVREENPTAASITHFFADMTQEQQRERLKFLLDYFDDEAKNRHADQYDWIYGKSSTVNIDRMRIDYPALYQVEHVERNIRWAAWIDKMLSAGGTHFICIGNNHTLGPDSILVQLQKRSIIPNPT